MEASGTPTPPAEPPQPPPPPPPAAIADDDRGSGGWRALAVLLVLALAFASLVMFIFAVDTGGTPVCSDKAGVAKEFAEEGADAQCWENSQTQKTISIAGAWAAGFFGALAAIVGLFFVFTGRQGRLVVQLTAAAIAFGAISLLIGNL